MHGIRWRAAALAVSLALLSSCASAAQPQTAEPVRVVRVLRLAVPVTLDAEVLRQAEAFAEDVGELSGGRMFLDVRPGQPTADTLAAGEQDLAFLRNVQMAQKDGRFSTFSLPFLFDDYRHMSLSLNSEEVMGRLNGALAPQDLRLLTAFYCGSSFLVTQAGELRSPANYKGIAAAMRTDNADKLAAFSYLGVRVLPYSASAIPSTLGTRAELLPEGADGPAEAVTVDTIEVDAAQALALGAERESAPESPPGDGEEQLCFIKTYHAATPLWLAANEQSLRELDDFERAVLAEACAGLLAGLEGAYISAEDAAFSELKAAGFEVVEVERQQIASMLYDSARNVTPDAEKYTPPAYFDRKLYEIIQSYSPLS